MRRPVELLPALVFLGGCGSGETPALRDFEYARPFHQERQLRAVVEFAAGRVWLGPGPANRLFQFHLQYDPARFEPFGTYDINAAVVHLGGESTRRGGIHFGRRSALAQHLTAGFSGAPDLALDVSLGAAEATLDLGGLRLSELHLKSGASKTAIGFSSPNPGICRVATVTSGAGELTVTNAGNSGCPEWRFDGGVGSATIDLDGPWPAGARIVLHMAVGRVTLRAPQSLGLRVTMRGMLAGFHASGFTKSERTYTSAGYQQAARKLDVDVSSALGGVTVDWR